MAVVDDVDWTGVAQRQRKVEPLSSENFVERLRLLSARAKDLRKLRSAMPASQQKP